MSSELLDVGDDQDGNSMLFTMRASGHAWLTICPGDEEENCVHYHLPANEIGFKNGEAIAKSILGWIEHIKLCNLYEEVDSDVDVVHSSEPQ